jgi:hypothetical protein
VDRDPPPGCPLEQRRALGLGFGRGEERFDVRLTVEGGLEHVGTFHHECTLRPAGGALSEEAADPPHPGVTHP